VIGRPRSPAALAMRAAPARPRSVPPERERPCPKRRSGLQSIDPRPISTTTGRRRRLYLFDHAAASASNTGHERSARAASLRLHDFGSSSWIAAQSPARGPPTRAENRGPPATRARVSRAWSAAPAPGPQTNLAARVGHLRLPPASRLAEDVVLVARQLLAGEVARTMAADAPVICAAAASRSASVTQQRGLLDGQDGCCVW
jgi:hypothetical protein